MIVMNSLSTATATSPMNNQIKRGRYKSSALVRGLRLQRLKDTTMSITAALDKRQAVQLGETVLPVPKVYGRKGGQFSDITRLLSGGTAPAGSVQSGGSTSSSSTSAPPDSVQKSSSMASMLSRDPATSEPSAIILPIDPQEQEDDRQVALILDTQRRKPGRGRRAADKGLSEYEDTLTKAQRLEWKQNCEVEVVRITRLLRQRHNKKKAALDSVGLFHPNANKMRMDTAFHAELKRRLQMDRIEEKCLRDMWAEFKGEAKLTRKNGMSSAMEDKFASMLSVEPSTELGAQSSIASVKSTTSSKRGKKNKPGGEKQSDKKDTKDTKDKKEEKGNNSSNSKKRRDSSSSSTKNGTGDRNKKDAAAAAAAAAATAKTAKTAKKVTFKPGDEVSKMEGGKIANETRTQLKNKVKRKFASGEADQDAERYDDEEVEEEEEEEEGEDEEEDEVWAGEGEEPESPMSGNFNDSKIRYEEGSTVVSNKPSKDLGGLEDSMEIGQTLADGSIVVDPAVPEDRYSEYEIRFDEWGQEVKVKLPPKVAPMAKTKKDTRVDPFAVFKKKKMQEYRAKKIARHRKLMAGKLRETTTDDDFVDELGYRTSTIRQALGHGKHTPARLKQHAPTPVGNKAMEKPLPGYIRNDMRMARKDAGFVDEEHEERMRRMYPQEPSHIATEPSSVPSWAVTTEASEMDPSTLGSMIVEEEVVIDAASGKESMVNSGGRISDEIQQNGALPATTAAAVPPASRGQPRRKSTLRGRLERVWEALEMPHSQKMLFAARYAEPRRAESMNDALPIWEKAANRIQMRERLLIVLWYLRQQVSNCRHLIVFFLLYFIYLVLLLL